MVEVWLYYGSDQQPFYSERKMVTVYVQEFEFTQRFRHKISCSAITRKLLSYTYTEICYLRFGSDNGTITSYL